jgi:hypothetical protein
VSSAVAHGCAIFEGCAGVCETLEVSNKLIKGCEVCKGVRRARVCEAYKAVSLYRILQGSAKLRTTLRTLTRTTLYTLAWYLHTLTRTTL